MPRTARDSNLLWLRLTPLSLALAAVMLAIADWGSQLAGDSLVPGAPIDEAAHLLTALLVLWALGPRLFKRFGVPALIASVAIDADHIPDRLGVHFLSAGTPRPYTHSLLTIGVVLALALVWRRRRDPLVGVGLGLAIHFWRDLADTGSGVSLLWPWSYHSFSVSHAGYMATMAAIVVLAAWRVVARGERRTRSRWGIGPDGGPRDSVRPSPHQEPT